MERKDRRLDNLDFKAARAEVLRLTDRMNVEIGRYHTAVEALTDEPTVGNLNAVMEKVGGVMEVAEKINGMMQFLKTVLLLDAVGTVEHIPDFVEMELGHV